MSPQHSSLPGRPRCTHTPVHPRTSSKCMYIHHKVPIFYEYRSRERWCGRMNPFYMPPPQGTLPRVRMLYPLGIATLIPDGSSPTTGGYESKTMLHRSCGVQCMYTHPLSGRVQASYEANHMQRSVGAPCPQESSNFTQSKRKNRPLYTILVGGSKDMAIFGEEEFFQSLSVFANFFANRIGPSTEAGTNNQ